MPILTARDRGQDVGGRPKERGVVGGSSEYRIEGALELAASSELETLKRRMDTLAEAVLARRGGEPLPDGVAILRAIRDE